MRAVENLEKCVFAKRIMTNKVSYGYVGESLIILYDIELSSRNAQYNPKSLILSDSNGINSVMVEDVCSVQTKMY